MRMEEVPRPVPQTADVLIRVSAVGICGSELSGYLGTNSLRRPPLIMGHEFAGSIEELGSQVTGLQPGDRVTVNPLISCGTCPLCRSGRENLCPSRSIVGIHRPGAFAHWVVVPASACHRLPAHVSDVAGTLAEPLACGLRAAELAHIGPAARVLVIGAGPIGLMSLAAARLGGATVIASSDPNPVRREVARAWGATCVIDPRAADPVQSMRDLTDGAGCDAVIDAVGAPETRRQAVQAVRPGGRVVFLGLHDDATELPGNYVVRWEIEVVGSFSYTNANMTAAVRLLANGLLSPDPSWLQERPLAQGDAAFAELIDQPSAIAKVVLHPW